MAVDERELLEHGIASKVVVVGHARCAGKYLPFFGHTGSNTRLCLYLYTFCNFYVSDKTCLSANATMRSNAGTACNARQSRNNRMCTYFDIVTHLYQVVQFDPLSDICAAHSGAVNGRTSTYFDVCLNDNVAQVRHFLVYSGCRIRNEAKAVTANDCIGMYYTAISNHAVMQNAHPRMKYYSFTQTNVDTDIYLIVEHTARAYNCTFFYDTEAANRYPLTQDSSRVDAGFGSNTPPLRGLCRLKTLKQRSEGFSYIVNPNEGRFQWLRRHKCAINNDGGGCSRVSIRLILGMTQKTNSPLSSLFNLGRAADQNLRLSLEDSSNDIGNFFGCYLHGAKVKKTLGHR